MAIEKISDNIEDGDVAVASDINQVIKKIDGTNALIETVNAIADNETGKIRIDAITTSAITMDKVEDVALAFSGDIEGDGILSDNSLEINLVLKPSKQAEINSKQPLLISGSTIKTINGTPVLGSGNIHIEDGILHSPESVGKVWGSDGSSGFWDDSLNSKIDTINTALNRKTDLANAHAIALYF